MAENSHNNRIHKLHDITSHPFVRQEFQEIHWQDSPTSDPISPHWLQVFTGGDKYRCTDLQIQLPSKSQRDNMEDES